MREARLSKRAQLVFMVLVAVYFELAADARESVFLWRLPCTRGAGEISSGRSEACARGCSCLPRTRMDPRRGAGGVRGKGGGVGGGGLASPHVLSDIRREMTASEHDGLFFAGRCSPSGCWQ